MNLRWRNNNPPHVNYRFKTQNYLTHSHPKHTCHSLTFTYIHISTWVSKRWKMHTIHAPGIGSRFMYNLRCPFPRMQGYFVYRKGLRENPGIFLCRFLNAEPLQQRFPMNTTNLFIKIGKSFPRQGCRPLSLLNQELWQRTCHYSRPHGSHAWKSILD